VARCELEHYAKLGRPAAQRVIFIAESIAGGRRFDVALVRAYCEKCPRSLQRCSGCKGRGRTRKPGVPAGFANGDSIARTARRLLDTLDGRCLWAPSAKAQASECQAKGCDGDGYIGPHTVESGDCVIVRDGHPCPDCRGTGHNLSGVLPPVEHRGPRR
jgi:hypothetical protein